MRECVRCSTGPAGLEGHLELTLHHDRQPRDGAAAGNHIFICVTCASQWERRYEGGGTFLWSRCMPE